MQREVTLKRSGSVLVPADPGSAAQLRLVFDWLRDTCGEQYRPSPEEVAAAQAGIDRWFPAEWPIRPPATSFLHYDFESDSEHTAALVRVYAATNRVYQRPEVQAAVKRKGDTPIKAGLGFFYDTPDSVARSYARYVADVCFFRDKSLLRKAAQIARRYGGLLGIDREVTDRLIESVSPSA